MSRIATFGIALFAAACMAAAPALAEDKKSGSDSKTSKATKTRVDAKAKSNEKKTSTSSEKKQTTSRETPKPKPASTTTSITAPKSKKQIESNSGDSARRAAEADSRSAARARSLAPEVQRELPREGNLENASSSNPTDPSRTAAEQRAGRKTPGSDGASAPSTSLFDESRAEAPTARQSRIDAGTPGTVANPVADPLARADGIASPAPTAEQLQAQSRAAKGDRTSQTSTVFRVNNEIPLGEMGSGLVDKDGEKKIVDPKDTAKAPPEKPEDEPEDDEDPDEAEEQANADAESTADCENVDAQGFCYDKGDDTETRPNDVNATDYVTRMTDAEAAKYRADTKAGLVNPTGAGASGGVVDPNSAREIGRSASPRAGWAIDPGTGEAGGAAPSANDAPERPDGCDLAGGGAGDCAGGDGLGQ
jgi:hypothetical protein